LKLNYRYSTAADFALDAGGDRADIEMPGGMHQVATYYARLEQGRESVAEC
jgi:hypothetical protein